MRSALRWLLWALSTVVGLVTIAVIAVVLYTRTESFKRDFAERALVLINSSIRGTISWDGLDGSLWRGLRVRNLKLAYNDREIFKAALAEVDYSLVPLLWKTVQITRLAASQPALDMRKLPNGEWNIVEALSSREPSTSESQWTVGIRGINIADGDLLLRPAEAQPEVYRLRKLTVTGEMRITEDLNVDLDQLASWIDAPKVPQVYASGALSYHQAAKVQRLGLSNFWLQTGQSRVMLAGALSDFSTFNSDLRLHLNRVAAADIIRYVPQWPAGFDITGQATLRGPANALDAKFDLAARGAQVSGSARADLISAAYPYSAALALRRLDLATVLGSREIAGTLSADVKLTGAGGVLDALNASAGARVQALVFQQRNIGEVTLQGNLRGSAAQVNGTIDGALGTSQWSGEVQLGAPLGYRAEISARAVDIARALQLKDAPPMRVSFDARVKGSGTDPATMNSEATIDILPSQLDKVQVDRGKITAAVAQGRIQVSELRVQANNATLNAQGDLGIAAPQSGRLRYSLDAAELRPWLVLVGQNGSGQLQLNGTAEGNLARLQTRGTVNGRQLQLQQVAIGTARANFNLVRTEGAALPQGTVDLQAAELHGPVDLATVRSTVTLPAVPEQTIGVRADARDTAGRAHRLVVDVEQRPAELRVRARELLITLADGAWRLSGPATLTHSGDDFSIDRIEMRSGRARVAAGGRFSLHGNQAFDAQADGIDLAAFRSFIPKDVNVSGVISAHAQVRGSAAAPVIEADAALSSGQLAGQRYNGMRARADYANQRVVLDLSIEQDEAHALQARGTIPLVLAWSPAWRAEPLPGMDLRARSSGLSLTFLNALKLPAENIRGEVALDLTITGSVTAPQPRGSFRLANGAFTVKSLGIDVNGIAFAGSGDARRVTISQFAARSGNGSLDGNGVMSLTGWMPQDINVSLAAQRWPAIQTERYRAIADATLRLTGTLKAPAISGKAQVIEGTVRPSLDFLDKGAVSRERDPTIVVVRQRGGAPVETPNYAKGENSDNNGLWRVLALNLAVVIRNNFWVRHPNANIELSGNLTIDKKSGSEPSLTGLVETVRGWVGFQGRRFELTRGVVRFTGGQPINPTLDVVGEYRSNDYTVTATAGGTASKPTLALSSTPQLDQSDILAVLLFGKPTSSLNSNEQQSLRENAIGVTAGFAASQLGKAVSDALGLETLGLDLSDVNFSGGEVRFGHYLGRQTYFSVRQEVADKHGREVALEYQLTPSIRVDATTRTDGNSGLDVIWHKRY